MKNQASVGFILVHYHAPEITLRCIESIVNHRSSAKKVVFIVDNGSSESERSLLVLGLEKLKIASRLLEPHENLGYAGAINFASQKIKQDFIAIVNNDAVLQEGWLDMLLKRLVSHLDVGIVGGIEVDGRDFHYPPMLVLKNLTTIRRHTSSEIIPVEFVSGSNMLIRRKDFRQWQKDYFLYYEDISACLDMWRSGKRVELVPSARVGHKANTTTSSIPIRKWLYATRNRYRLGYEFLSKKELSRLWLQGLKGDVIGSIGRLLITPLLVFKNALFGNKQIDIHEWLFSAQGRFLGFISAVLNIPKFLNLRRQSYVSNWSLARLLNEVHNR